MYFCYMIVVTGAAGFIGSCLIAELNNLGFNELILVDDFSNTEKNKNIINKKFLQKVERMQFIKWLNKHFDKIDCIYHIGARTDTSEFNTSVFKLLNLDYSKKLWCSCAKFDIPFIYASSAATYGLGENGFNDCHDIVSDLKPLNPYGESKNEFDKWVLKQEKKPPYWAGFKFFNVYGPNEFHKGRMASVVYHAFIQIQQSSQVKLFKSHNSNYSNGEQLRDFIYVKDVVNVLIFMMKKKKSGIYNLGTGQARTFFDLVNAIFDVLNINTNISFIDIPDDIKDKYQYFTEANMQKLKSTGYRETFYSLEKGILDYVNNYLLPNKYY